MRVRERDREIIRKLLLTSLIQTNNKKKRKETEDLNNIINKVELNDNTANFIPWKQKIHKLSF